MLDSTTMDNHILPKLAEMAYGKLIAGLKFVPTLNRWNDPKPGTNANEWRVPTADGGSAKERTAGGPVVFEDRTADYVSMTAKQFYDAFITDESYDASSGIAYFDSFLETAVNNIIEKVETYAADQIANQAGLGYVGTLGSAMTRANFQTARTAFINSKIPTNNLKAFVSAETLNDLSNIAEFTRFDAVGGIPENAFRSGVVDRAGGFELLESPYVYSPSAGQHANLLFDPKQITYIFPAQKEVSKGGTVKAEFAKNGVRIYILEEQISGFNGATGYTVSVNFAVKAIRSAGVIVGRGK